MARKPGSDPARGCGSSSNAPTLWYSTKGAAAWAPLFKSRNVESIVARLARRTTSRSAQPSANSARAPDHHERALEDGPLGGTMRLQPERAAVLALRHDPPKCVNIEAQRAEPAQLLGADVNVARQPPLNRKEAIARTVRLAHLPKVQARAAAAHEHKRGARRVTRLARRLEQRSAERVSRARRQHADRQRRRDPRVWPRHHRVHHLMHDAVSTDADDAVTRAHIESGDHLGGVARVRREDLAQNDRGRVEECAAGGQNLEATTVPRCRVDHHEPPPPSLLHSAAGERILNRACPSRSLRLGGARDAVASQLAGRGRQEANYGQGCAVHRERRTIRAGTYRIGQ
eukprot:1922415-Prymnesium_polylepis.1